MIQVNAGLVQRPLLVLFFLAPLVPGRIRHYFITHRLLLNFELAKIPRHSSYRHLKIHLKNELYIISVTITQ